MRYTLANVIISFVSCSIRQILGGFHYILYCGCHMGFLEDVYRYTTRTCYRQPSILYTSQSLPNTFVQSEKTSDFASRKKHCFFCISKALLKEPPPPTLKNVILPFILLQLPTLTLITPPFLDEHRKS
jgi:hypothetical protein